ncbi:unnamed protein product [Somion occarium]|uniref:Yeast cell wall synthesis Kre9/Knh1-like N-terminal domain-containing protein n=1 Tax=Somion occarium TaxID=3059160 RepID=A0ABP1E2V3_9APHY
MFSQALVAAFIATLAVSRAEPVPSEPGPGSSFNEGANCPVTWEVDTTGVWKTMNIELMSGSNLQMNHITTIATVDGTDPTKAEFTFPCPAIYFYQFSSPATTNLTWTTRFTIADATGNSVPPANANQPNGDPIPWGIGALEDPSKATPPPTAGAANTSGSTAGTSSSSSPASGPPAASSVSSAPTSGASSTSSGVTRVTSTSASAAALSTSTTNSTKTGEADSTDSGATSVAIGRGLMVAVGALAAAMVL